MKQNQRYFLIISVLLVLIAGSVMAANPDNSVEQFRNALKSKSGVGLEQLMASGGLVLVRSYNQDNPNKGKDVLTKVNDLPDNLRIAASSELPFDLKYLFGGSARIKNLKYLEQKFNGGGFDFSIPSIRAFAKKVIEFANEKTPSFTPTVVTVGERYLVLIEAEASNDMLSGSMAIFERANGQYLLKVVVDLR